MKKIVFIPSSKIGWWSTGLIAAVPILMILAQIFIGWLYPNVEAGNSLLEDIAARPVLSLAMVLAMLSGVIAFACGLAALIKQKDRSLLVFITTFLGGLLLLLLIAEFTFME